MSRPSWVVPNMMRSGAAEPAASATAAARCTPARPPFRSPVLCSVVAPWAPTAAGDGVGVGAGVERLDRVAELAGLGQHLEGDGGHLAVDRFGVDPDLGKRHVCSLVSSARGRLR